MSVRSRNIMGRIVRDLNYIRGAHESLKGLMTVQQDLTRIAIEQCDLAKSRQIAGFYEEEVPQFEQGEPHHELQSLVTAEEVTGYVTKIKTLRDGLVRLRAGITEHADDTVWSGPGETAVDAITLLLGDNPS